MEIKTLKCPECGANFESKENVTFCSHCGAKLYFDDGTRNVNYNYKTEDVAKVKEIEVNKELELDKRQQEKKDKVKNEKELKIAFLIMFLIIVLGIGFLFFLGRIEENEIKLNEETLQSIVDEIYIDIDNENYEDALIKAKSLYYPSNSGSKKEKWDDIRETLTEMIEEKMN